MANLWQTIFRATAVLNANALHSFTVLLYVIRPNQRHSTKTRTKAKALIAKVIVNKKYFRL